MLAGTRFEGREFTAGARGSGFARVLRASLRLLAGVLFACAFGSSHASLLAISTTGSLYDISTSDASLSLIGNTGISNWADIQFAPDGTLYGFTTVLGALYTIDPITAAATPVGPLGLSFIFEGALAIAPDGTAYGTNGNASTSAQLFTIDLTTGAASVVATLSGGSHDINGLAWRSSDDSLIGLDRVTNSLLLIDPANGATSSLHSIVPTVGVIGGMTLSGGVGYFATNDGASSAAGSGQLLSFDPSTGVQTSIGSFQADISGLAAPPAVATVPEPGDLILLATALACMAIFLRRRALRVRS